MLKKTKIIIPLILLTSCNKQIPIQGEIKTSKDVKPYVIPETITLKKDEPFIKNNKFNLNELEKEFLKDVKKEDEIEDIKVEVKNDIKKYEDIKNEKIKKEKDKKEELRVKNPEKNQNVKKEDQENNQTIKKEDQKDQEDVIYEEIIEITEYTIDDESNNESNSETNQNNKPTFTPNSVTISNITYPIFQNIENHEEGQKLIDQTEFGWVDFSYIMRKTYKTINDNNNLYLAAHGSNSGKKIFEANEIIFTDINGNRKKYIKNYESAIFPSGQSVYADELQPELMCGKYTDAIVFQTCIDEFANAKYVYFSPEQ